MGEGTKIEWTTDTFNHVIGCVEVSPGCDHCYARTLATGRMGLDVWGPCKPRKRTMPAYWKRPLAWNKAAGKAGTRRFVFCASMADVFEEGTAKYDPDDGKEPEVSLDAVRAELFALIRATPNLTWQLLTKRPGNILRMTDNLRALPSNVWLGFSAESQFWWDARIRDVRKIRNAGWKGVVFTSAEPLLGPIDLADGVDLVDWVIAGGESGHHARPMETDWVRSLRDQCTTAGVAFFFKQWGEFLPVSQDPKDVMERGPGVSNFDASKPEKPFDVWHRVGKKEAGRFLDGRTWDELPDAEAVVHA